MSKSKIWHYVQRVYPYLFIIGLTIIIMYPQMKSQIYLAGLDSWFHMNQVYDTAMQFKTGHFSYFVSLFGFGGIGRIVNAVYGPGFAYLSGFILFLVKTWYRFEIIQDFSGLILGGWFFYLLAHRNNVTTFIATLLSMLYMMSEPVLTWVINQEFNGIEAILIPLILLQGTQIALNKRIHPWSLGIIMALVFQTHMLTTLVGTLTLVPFFIYAWCRTNQKRQLWEKLIQSVGLTILLTANVWGSMLNVFTQNLIPPDPQGKPSSGGAVMFIVSGHYFSVLGFIYSVIMLFLIVCCIISLLFWRRSTGLYKIISFGGLFVCWLSSVYFPWQWVLKIYPAFTYQIQFPKRFLCLGIVLMLLSTGMLFSGKDVNIINCQNKGINDTALVIIQMILIAFIGCAYINQKSLFQYGFDRYNSKRVIAYGPFYEYRPNDKTANKLRTAYHSSKLLSNGVNLVHQDLPDYLPTTNIIHNHQQYRDNAPYSGMQNQIYVNLHYLHPHRKYSNNRLIMKWHANQTKHNVMLPVTKYRDTQVVLNHHILHRPKISRMGMTNVDTVYRGTNRVSISYQEPIWLHILMWITVLSWLGVLIRTIYLIYLKFRSRIPM